MWTRRTLAVASPTCRRLLDGCSTRQMRGFGPVLRLAATRLSATGNGFEAAGTVLDRVVSGAEVGHRVPNNGELWWVECRAVV